MPDITFLGWVHTILGISAISVGMYDIVKNKYFSVTRKISQLYFWLTFFTAITALNIYNQGGFGISHILAIFALAALFVGWMTETFDLAGKYTAHLFTLNFSSTFLFHLFPAIADSLRRLPLGNPIADSLTDPVILQSYALLLVGFLGLLIYQLTLIRRGYF
ncbi:MAG: hypothetical protein VW146_02515 [Gammaproteobacteria bacterium]